MPSSAVQECTIQDGAVQQTNFHDYNVMRIADMPKVESIIMPSGDFWGGVGEPTIFVAAPAMLNAIFAATGKHYRTFPLLSGTPEALAELAPGVELITPEPGETVEL